MPPIPPAPPVVWRRREPIAAIVLIAMGVLFLMGQMDWFSGRMLEFTWPVLLIGLGAWLLFRRMYDGQAPPPPAAQDETQDGGKNPRGGSL